jgi:hypothetical protein
MRVRGRLELVCDRHALSFAFRGYFTSWDRLRCIYEKNLGPPCLASAAVAFRLLTADCKVRAPAENARRAPACGPEPATLLVDSFAADQWGLYNVHGNYNVHGHVWEWVQDYWKLNWSYKGAPSDGSVWICVCRLSESASSATFSETSRSTPSCSK